MFINTDSDWLPLAPSPRFYLFIFDWLFQVNLNNFVIEPPVTFRLKSGSGPVLLSGEVIVGKAVTSESVSLNQ